MRVYSGPGAFTVVARDVNAEPLSTFAGFDNAAFLTDAGHVAFIADIVGGGRGVFLASASEVVTIATLAHPDVSEIAFFRPVANSGGLVAFRGRDGAGLHAVFVGDGLELRRVIGEHDLVPTDLGTGRIDQHDSSVVFGGSLSINARGDVAFNAALTPENNPMIEWGSGMFIAYADAATGSPPVPDGHTVPGQPLRVAKTGGLDLAVTWDASRCPAGEYNLFAGDLADVAMLALDAAACSLGTSGSATFTPPPGEVFFFIASESRTGVEGNHGFQSDGSPRPSSGVGFCGTVEQATDASCP
jgi:hypothetical protein